MFIERLVSEGQLKLVVLKDKAFAISLSKIPGMSLADAEVLALAKELSAVAIVDETVSRAVAEAEGIGFHGIVFLLFLLFRKKMIPKKDIKTCVDEMIGLGWRCSTEFYATILAEIEKL